MGGSGGGMFGMDAANEGPGGTQAQPTNPGISEVEPGTPVEDCKPSDPDCLSLKAPGGDPEPTPPPDGPDDLTF
jgi:hypothetical protein